MKLINSQLFYALPCIVASIFYLVQKKYICVSKRIITDNYWKFKLSIPIHITATDLNSMINKLVEKHFSIPMVLDNGYRIKIQVQKNITFNANNNQIQYGIPIAIEIYPSAEISSVKADGIILIELSTFLNLLNNKIVSKTEYTKHSWIQTPLLKSLEYQFQSAL
ncbi:MAG: DUF4403 family protein [Saprospiraceae bacterium]|nr:DUF4403 family protein [Saprospiraceae bacterium]